MLHDGIQGCPSPSGDQTRERRRSDRVPFPAELVLRWHHDQGRAVRYEIVDVSDGGFRIRAGTPVLEGMTGTVLSLLPDGQKLNQAVMVVWIARANDDGRYDIGLRTFRPVF